MNSVIKITDRDREYPFSHLIQCLCLIAFFMIWILDSFIFHFSTDLTSIIPLLIKVPLFLSTLVVAIIILRLSHDALFNSGHTEKQENDDHHHPDELIETGILAHVRHPLYLGILLAYVAFILLTLSIISFILWIGIFLIYDLMASFEEKQLERMFGETYFEYKKRVPKWIPI